MPDALEEKTEIQVVADHNQASALFGLSSGLEDTTVIDQTFDDVSLVGHPLTVGFMVNQTGASAVITAVTTTYSPYLEIGDDANPNPRNDQIIQGTPFQEFATNFPLGSQVLTGLFLNVTLSGPQGASQTYQHTILDRLGYAARQGLAPPAIRSIRPPRRPSTTLT